MYQDIRTREDLLDREAEIKDLFRASFDQDLSRDDWRWFYVDNPVGPAYVSLFYQNDLLLGHYAVVPTRLSLRGQSFVAYRSMTTMVHPNGRGRGLFTELANRVYAMLQEDQASLVYGFPNGNSAPGFAKYLGWSLLPPDRVVDLSGRDLLADAELCAVLTRPGEIEWDAQEKEQATWRYSRPHTYVVDASGLVIKPYEGILNVLHMSELGLASIHPDDLYRVLVPADFKPEIMQPRTKFNYQFGYRAFDPRFGGATFRRELVMSDVF